MGYDMYIVTADPGEEEAVAEARKLFDAACAKRDALTRGSGEHQAAQAEVDTAYVALDAARRTYFRLNVWGMGIARESMYTLAMLDVDASSPDWPEREDFGVDDQVWNAYDGDEPGEDAPEGIRRFHAAQEAALAAHPEPAVGICAFKLGSNDGWLVTPAELDAALAIYDKHATGGGNVPSHEWWSEWIDYLRRAATRGGFRVH